jgi:hypothetical protein
MMRRSRVWLAVNSLFTLVNVGGGVYALAQSELLHAGTHGALALLGAYFAWRTAPRRDAPGRDAQARHAPAPRELTDRLTNLEQAVDAVAIEVERIGEGQRFMTRLFAESERPAGEREAPPARSSVSPG